MWWKELVSVNKSDWHRGEKRSADDLLYITRVKATPETLRLRSGSHKCIIRDTCMYTSVMWQHIKCIHGDMLARAHSVKHQRCHTKTGIQTGGRDPALLLQSLPSFWGKIGSPASFPIFPPQLSFNQPMQMLSLSLCPSFFLSIFLSIYLLLSISLSRSLLSPVLLASQ